MATAIGMDISASGCSVAFVENGIAHLVPTTMADDCRTAVSLQRAQDPKLVEPGAPGQVVRDPLMLLGTPWTVSIGDGETYTAEDACAALLLRGREKASAYLGESVDSAVIAVPTNFDICQTAALREASRRAGLRLYRAIKAPVAAVLFDTHRAPSAATHLVVQLDRSGVGAAVIETGEGVVEVVAAGGDISLTLGTWDARLSEVALSASEADALTVESSERVLAAAERARRELYVARSTSVLVRYLDTRGGSRFDLAIDVARSEYYDATADLVSRTEAVVEQVLRDAESERSTRGVPRFGRADLSRVLLVGEGTRDPRIMDSVHRITSHTVSRPKDEDAVALGAALQAGVIVGEVTDALLLDVTSLAVAVETVGGVATPVIARNTTIPTRRSEMFTIARAD